MDRREQILACLLCGMIGDALGAAYEGIALGSKLEAPSRLNFTDDTQLTIATCESIVEEGEVLPHSIADRFLYWFRQRKITGIGASTLKALAELDHGGHWASVGATGERSAGNGAAMRIAPLAFFAGVADRKDRQLIRDVCSITHRNDEAYLGALAIVASIRHVAVEGGKAGDLIEGAIAILPDSQIRDRLKECSSISSIEEYGERFSASGFVVDSVPLAILAASREAGFLESIRKLIGCGGDTDTVCSMFGQIQGSAYGISSEAEEMLPRINGWHEVRDTATDLAML